MALLQFAYSRQKSKSSQKNLTLQATNLKNAIRIWFYALNPQFFKMFKNTPTFPYAVQQTKICRQLIILIGIKHIISITFSIVSLFITVNNGFGL